LASSTALRTASSNVALPVRCLKAASILYVSSETAIVLTLRATPLQQYIAILALPLHVR